MPELILWNSVKKAIAAAHRVDEVKQIRDKAEAYRYALKLAGEAPAVVRQAEEIKLRAERRAGELLQEQPKDEGGRPSKNRSEDKTGFPTYEEQGIDKRDASTWQRIAEIPEERFEQFIAETPEITTAGALRLAKENVHFSSKTDEWTTPKDVIALVIKCLGEIDLDPCADANDSVPAFRCLHEQEDGLTTIWKGRIYMNPPYGDVLPAWIEKLCAEHKCGNVKEAIALIPSRTDTQWFRQMADFPRCFLYGRLKFGGQENSAPFPSMAVYFGKNNLRFKEVFSKVGDIYVRY